MSLQRETRLQIMLDETELAVIDDWRFSQRMPSRAAAIRQLITLGLKSIGHRPDPAGMRSQDFGVTAKPGENSTAEKLARQAPPQQISPPSAQNGMVNNVEVLRDVAPKRR